MVISVNKSEPWGFFGVNVFAWEQNSTMINWSALKNLMIECSQQLIKANALL